MEGSTVEPLQVLNQLINDGLFDTLRKSITAELEGNIKLKSFTTEEVEKSHVLQAPGAERRSRRELFESLRRELQTKVLERASKAAWHAILSKDGVGFQIEEQVEKTWWELNGWGMPPERARPAKQKLDLGNSPVEEAKVAALCSSTVSEPGKEVTGQVEETGVDCLKGQPQDGSMAAPLVAADSAACLQNETPLATEVQYVPLSVDADPNESAPLVATTAGLLQENKGVFAVEITKGQGAAEDIASRISESEVEVAEEPAPESLASSYADGKAAGERSGEDAAQVHQKSSCKKEDALEVLKREGAVAGVLKDSTSERGEVDANTTGGAVREPLSGMEAKPFKQDQISFGAQLPVIDACEAPGVSCLAEAGSIVSRGPETVESLISSTGVLLVHTEPPFSGRSQGIDISNSTGMQLRGAEGVPLTARGAGDQSDRVGGE